MGFSSELVFDTTLSEVEYKKSGNCGNKDIERRKFGKILQFGVSI